MTERQAQVMTVSELTRLVKELLEGAILPFWLAGEVGNLTIHRSGHVYLTLKDARTQIGGVFFNGAGAARRFDLAEGMEVEVFGSLGVYEPRGVYQVIIRDMRPKGLGSLQQQFEALKRKLHDEGLFAPERKRPIPRMPRCIGVVTSTEGAALRDFLQIIGRRFAGMHIRVVPASVQGASAPPQLIAGIEYLNRHQACDVIVLTRGGGSLEDLWAFNDERLARAIAASRLPVISAVGHEVDFTIADFVADLRCPTPSAAAELVVGQHAEFVERIGNLERRLASGLHLRLGELRRRVERAAHHHVFREPMYLVRRYQQRVDELNGRLQRELVNRLQRSRDRLGQLDSHLRLLNPRSVLTRGYAILLDRETGKAITDASQATPGYRLRGLLARGEIELEVIPSISRGEQP